MPKITKTQAYALNIPNKSLQTILFDKDSWNIPQAKHWLKIHKYHYKEWRQTANQYRFWQIPDIIGAKFYSKRIPTLGVVLVFQEY